jgi:antitoxin component YwqK of YwqJK toxin-antitoxin module
MSDKVFWYEKNGEKHCCFTASELKALALSGEIDSSCSIWKEGTKNWIPATSVNGLLPAEPPAAPLQDSIPPVDNVSPEPEQVRTAEPPNSPDETDSSGLKNSIIQKFQNLDLINRWKSLSLVKKILCIAAIVSAFAIGLLNLLVLLVILLPVLWFIALFKPSIVRANTRMQATKHILFALILVFVVAGVSGSFMSNGGFFYNGDEVVTAAIQERNGISYIPNSNEPFTGKYVLPPYKNGQKQGEVSFKDGKQDGLTTSWYTNGQKKTEANYKNGEKNGLNTNWFENGQKEAESNYKDGKEDGLTTVWYTNEQKKSEMNYKDGKEDGLAKKWSENGQQEVEVNYKDGEKDGLFTQWYGNGQKQIEVNYKNGKEDGLVTGWSENGQKEAEVNYKDGKKDGLNTQWYENGKKKSESNYKDGKKDGLATEWHENGQKKAEGNYKDEKQDGLTTLWYENGQKEAEINFKDGNIDGVPTQWSESGQIKKDL